MQQTKTIPAIIVGIILLIAQWAGVSLSEGELSATWETILKLAQVGAFVFAWIFGKKELGTNSFGRKTE